MIQCFILVIYWYISRKLTFFFWRELGLSTLSVITVYHNGVSHVSSYGLDSFLSYNYCFC